MDFHCLRHTFVTDRLRGGENIKVVQRLAHHSSMSQTERYSHAHTDELRAAMPEFRPLKAPKGKRGTQPARAA
jgi:site-specific recombinase XerD